MSTPELEVIKDIPGYKVILKAVLKSQIQQLVEQLAAHTDEESVILTASVSDGTLSHMGSDSGKTFLVDHEDIKSQFLGFCLRKHHKKKQEEKERQEREEAMRNLPTTPTRQPGPRFSQRSPRFPSPRHQGVYPMALTRASPRGPMRSPGMRHEPYQRPMKRPNFNQQGQGPSQPPRMPLSGQVIKIEAVDPDDNETSNTDSNNQPSDSGPGSSQPSSPSQANAEMNQSGQSLKTETSDKEEDAKSESSASTIPNEASDLKLGDSAPPEGLTLDSDLSSLLPNMEDSSGGDNQQPDTPQTPTSAPQTPGSSSELDPNVNVKVEAITESEMELEITGVELGPQHVQPGNVQESWGPNVPGGAMGYSPQGASGSQADMQQGYSTGHSPQQVPDASDMGSLATGYEDMGGGAGVNFPEGWQIKVRTCDHCGKMFASNWELERHTATHTGVKPFSCKYCNFRCARKDYLRIHTLKKHHSPTTTTTASTESSGD